MRMCMDHWNALRKAIDDRGLYGLVAKSGEAAIASIVRHVEKTADQKADFDPLMNANFAIYAAFLEDAGPAGLCFDGCPLCEVAKSPKEKLDEEWINGVSDDQLATARALGLVAAVQ